MASAPSSSSYTLIFYKQGQFPQSWDALPEGSTCSDIDSLVLNLTNSPLFGTGKYLGPRFYDEGGLTQVPFHTRVFEQSDEPVYFWDFYKKKFGLGDLVRTESERKELEGMEPDKIIVRGAQLVEGRWVVYYSMSDSPTPLYGILHSVFKERVKIHPPQPNFVNMYGKVMGGPGLPRYVQKVVDQFTLQN